MNRIPTEQVEWVSTGILQRDDGPQGGTYRWRFDLPRPLADWDVFEYWERERFEHMAATLARGEILFDIGTEQGWCNLPYADMVGPDNIVLIEPTPEFWPNIRQTWERNYYGKPRACYHGLIGATTNDDREWTPGWPHPSDGWIIDRNRYQYLHDNDGVAQIRLDDLVQRIGVAPDALTIDVEGAELDVLHGATGTLVTHRPKVWASLHADLIEANYHATLNDVHTFMESLGYTGHHLATDHEQHWYFAP